LEQVILRCLEKRPEDRFQYIDALSEALSACQCAGQWSDADARAWWWELEHGRT
jgi:serine/threonine-protein kinase